jgi:hypothetical protein
MHRLTPLLLAWAAVLAACAGPESEMTTANQKPPGPGCSTCILENPGDVRPCVKICHQPEGDLAGPDAGGVIR